MKKLRLTQIINEWDPIGIISFTPENEYQFEIKKIEDVLLTCNKNDVEFLAKEIKKIFTESFGENIFTKQLAECEDIAKKILDIYTTDI